MMHEAWSSIEEVHYWFSRSSVIFQGRTGQKIADFDPNSVFPDCNSRFNWPMFMKWCTRAARCGKLGRLVCHRPILTGRRKIRPIFTNIMAVFNFTENSNLENEKYDAFLIDHIRFLKDKIYLDIITCNCTLPNQWWTDLVTYFNVILSFLSKDFICLVLVRMDSHTMMGYIRQQTEPLCLSADPQRVTII